jgi:hypothetical protein
MNVMLLDITPTFYTVITTLAAVNGPNFLGQCIIVGLCEESYKHSCSIKARSFFDRLSDYQPLK